MSLNLLPYNNIDLKTNRILEQLTLSSRALAELKAVVAQGLDLKEIVERSDAFELRVAFMGHNGLEQLACLAGRADNETLTESDKL